MQVKVHCLSLRRAAEFAKHVAMATGMGEVDPIVDEMQLLFQLFVMETVVLVDQFSDLDEDDARHWVALLTDAVVVLRQRFAERANGEDMMYVAELDNVHSQLDELGAMIRDEQEAYCEDDLEEDGDEEYEEDDDEDEDEEDDEEDEEYEEDDDEDEDEEDDEKEEEEEDDEEEEEEDDEEEEEEDEDEEDEEEDEDEEDEEEEERSADEKREEESRA